MGDIISLTTPADRHTFSAYRADPLGVPRGALVVVQEIFGVNHHVRAVCDGFAAAGYAAIAPALFDRLEPGVDLPYDAGGVARGREHIARLGWDAPLRDVETAARELRASGKVGVIGYCWGGSVAWLAATRLDVACAVGYYGRHVVEFNREQPRCPTMLHFGEVDATIPMANVEAIRAAHPEVTLHTYPDAGHGFNCDARASYHPPSAALALERTLEFLGKKLR